MPVYLEFSNDDDAVFYINGVEIYNTGSRCNKDRIIELPSEARAALTGGTNMLAAECINPVGFGLLDFGLLIPKSLDSNFPETAFRHRPTCRPHRLIIHLPAARSTSRYRLQLRCSSTVTSTFSAAL